MSIGDGNRIAESLSAKVVKFVRCSRWSELQQTVEYHAKMAALLKAPTVFRLLNDPGRMIGPQQFSIGERGQNYIQEDVDIVLQTMRQASPSGSTPLSQHLIEIRQNIESILPQLEGTGQKVAVILATDGLPTDRYGRCDSNVRSEFEDNLRLLAGLPIWLVVRLCTDEESVVNYYNNLDSNLELSLEVLDDWTSEGQEVMEFNPWLNYGLCLHRIREMGSHHRLFDLLDERPLTLDEIREFLILLFGSESFDGIPDPNLEFNAFMSHLGMVCSKNGNTWNPIKKKMSPWVDMKILKTNYNPNNCSIM